MKKNKKPIKKRKTIKVTYPVVEQTFKGRQSENPILYKADRKVKSD